MGEPPDVYEEDSAVNDALLSYIARLALSKVNEDVQTRQYRRTVPLVVNEVPVLALVDSGNVFRNVCSPAFMAKLGLTKSQLDPVPHSSLSTAKAGAEMEVLGAMPVTLQFGSLEKKFQSNFVVVNGLTHEVNICGPFLRHHGIDQLHSEDALLIDGVKIALSSAGGNERDICATVYVEKGFIAKPRSISFVNLCSKRERTRDKALPPGEYYLQGQGNRNLQLTSLWTGVFVLGDDDGRMIGGVFNTSSKPVHVHKYTRYGRATTARPMRAASNGLAINYMDEASVSSLKEAQRVQAVDQADDVVEGRTPTTPPSEHPYRTLEDVIEHLRLKDPDVCFANEDERNQAAALLFRYRDVFTTDGSFGKTELLEHAIETEPGPPIRCKTRPLNPALEKELEKQIDAWIKHDVIEPTSSPWSFPLLAIPKKNGDYRWAVDYRRLNARTIKDAFPVPSIEDNLARLSHSKVFSAIDGAGAFHVVPIAKKDRAKTAFTSASSGQQYRFKRMPFGLTNAPATYSRLVQLVLSGIPYSMALPYLDDTAVHSKDFKTHCTALARVLEAHRKAGLRLQPKKCQLFRTKINYLGHEVAADGIRPAKDYVAIVAEWPFPKTVADVRVFLGKTGYYRRFLRDYARRAKPLSDLLGGDFSDKGAAVSAGGTSRRKMEENTPVEATEERLAAFEDLKLALTEHPVLAYPQFDSGSPFILDTDWSRRHNTVGGVLSQVQDGQERVIAYGARKLNAAAKNYSSHKGELNGIIIFLKLWKYYLQPAKFKLRVDNAALTWIKSMEEPPQMISRWLERLGSYDFEVEHRAGVKHGNADALSRLDHAPQAEEDEDYDDEKVYHLRSMNEAIMSLIPDQDDATGIVCDAAELKRQQEEDDTLAKVREWLESGKFPDSLDRRAMSSEMQWYAGKLPKLEINDKGLICHKAIDSPTGKGSLPQRVCIPEDMQTAVASHAHLAGGHMGISVTSRRVEKQVYFPGIKRVCSDYIERCDVCQRKGRAPKQQMATLIPFAAGYPFMILAIDFVGPLNPSKNGCTYVLTVKDCFTRWLEAFPLKAATAVNTVRMLEEHVFSRYGLPEKIHSDNGQQFNSNLFHLVAKTYGIRVSKTPPYNAKSNPVERAHRDLGPMLKAIAAQAKVDWEEALTPALFALRTAVCRQTGYSPFELLHGRNPRTALSVIFGDPNPPIVGTKSYHDYVRTLQKKLDAAHEAARLNIAESIRRQRKLYNADSKEFFPGAKVWLWTPRSQPGVCRKLSTFWSGPWIIDEKLYSHNYVISPAPEMNSTLPTLTVSVDRLKAYKVPRAPKGLLPPVIEPEFDEELLDPDEDTEMVCSNTTRPSPATSSAASGPAPTTPAPAAPSAATPPPAPRASPPSPPSQPPPPDPPAAAEEADEPLPPVDFPSDLALDDEQSPREPPPATSTPAAPRAGSTRYGLRARTAPPARFGDFVQLLDSSEDSSFHSTQSQGAGDGVAGITDAMLCATLSARSSLQLEDDNDEGNVDDDQDLNLQVLDEPTEEEPTVSFLREGADHTYSFNDSFLNDPMMAAPPGALVDASLGPVAPTDWTTEAGPTVAPADAMPVPEAQANTAVGVFGKLSQLYQKLRPGTSSPSTDQVKNSDAAAAYKCRPDPMAMGEYPSSVRTMKRKTPADVAEFVAREKEKAKMKKT